MAWWPFPSAPNSWLGSALCSRNKKRARRPASCKICARASALGELEGATGLGAAVLFALHHAGVTGKEPAFLEDRAQFRLVMGKGLGNAVANRTGLARETAAGYRCNDVVLSVAVGGNDWL